jgi:hypothetical protein
VRFQNVAWYVGLVADYSFGRTFPEHTRERATTDSVGRTTTRAHAGLGRLCCLTGGRVALVRTTPYRHTGASTGTLFSGWELQRSGRTPMRSSARGPTRRWHRSGCTRGSPR